MNSTWLKYLPDFLGNSLAGRRNLQKLTGDTGWLFADKILHIGVGLVVGIWIACYLGPDQFGLDNNAVGVYSAAIRISEVCYFIPIAIIASVTPAPIKTRKTGTALYYRRIAGLFRLMVVIALAIAVPMTYLSGYVARSLYGSMYEGVGPILAIHIWAALFVFLGVAQNPWTINEGQTSLALLRTVVGAVANVLLNVVLIPKYGPAGAAVATSSSYALSAVVLNAFSPGTRGIFKLQLNAMPLIVPSKR